MSHVDDAELLEQAVDYAFDVVRAVEPRFLRKPTPCVHWDLRKLLLHVATSVESLCAGFECGTIVPSAPRVDDPDDPAALVRHAAGRLLRAARTVEAAGRPVAVGDQRLPAHVLALAGSLEIAVHGWDVAQACGSRVPIPAGVAVELLPVAAALVTQAERGSLFAAAVVPPPGADPGDRLVAFLGRRP